MKVTPTSVMNYSINPNEISSLICSVSSYFSGWCSEWHTLFFYIIHNTWARSYKMVIKIPILHVPFLQGPFFILLFSSSYPNGDTHAHSHTHEFTVIWPQRALLWVASFPKDYCKVHLRKCIHLEIYVTDAHTHTQVCLTSY